ncbi:MAG: anhydro-N-acetylmuramic acid kinase [Phycisphaerales bacterium]
MSPPGTRQRLVVGAMTGTSIDGIDVIVAQIDGGGLGIRAELIKHLGRGLGPLANDLREAAQQTPMSAQQFAKLGLALGELHATAITELLEPNQAVDLITVHGQTIIHQPPISWQLIDPMPIAREFGCPVIYDLRQADLAAGGQGAPITPIADWILYRQAERTRAIVNLGGFCNVTIIPRDGAPNAVALIEGFDVCACNHVLDAVAREALGEPFDKSGQAALAGQPQPPIAHELANLLGKQAKSIRSLGTSDDLVSWVASQCGRTSPQDLAASVVDGVASCIAQRLKTSAADEVILAGGGALNEALVKAIAAASDKPVTTSDDFGIPPTAREALAIAVLGVLCADGMPITLPQVTGCLAPAPLAGRWCLPASDGMPVGRASKQNR